jgi:hypothetical protein
MIFWFKPAKRVKIWLHCLIWELGCSIWDFFMAKWRIFCIFMSVENYEPKCQNQYFGIPKILYRFRFDNFLKVVKSKPGASLKIHINTHNPLV